MSDRTSTSEYRFPRIHNLFHALAPLKTQTTLLIERIQDFHKLAHDDLFGSREFVYSAPRDDTVSPGSAVEEGRSYLQIAEDPTKAVDPKERRYKERRVITMSTTIDYFHQTNRAWHRQIDEARRAIDEAAEELDQGVVNLFKRPSIRIRLTLDELAGAVTYDGTGVWDHPDWPPLDGRWIPALNQFLPPVSKWMDRIQSVGHMRRSTIESAPPGGTINAVTAKPLSDSSHSSLKAAKSKNRSTKSTERGSRARIVSLQGDVWEVRFDGDRFMVKDQLGIRYLATVLHQPDKSFSGRDLHLLARNVTSGASRSNPIPEQLAGQGLTKTESVLYDKRLDDKALDAAEDRRDQLISARISRKLTAKEEDEFGKLTAQLKKDTGLGGKSRSFATKADSSRDMAVRQALKRAIGSLKQPVQAGFAKHLSKYFKYTASEIIYHPARTEAAWTHI